MAHGRERDRPARTVRRSEARAVAGTWCSARRAIRPRGAHANALTAAVLHLLDEGATRPTSEQIAQRAEVSERSLYQHFPTREELLLAAWQLGRAQGRSAPIPRSLSLGERIGAIADTRAKLWEVLGPSERAIRRCDDRTAAAALAEERDRDRAELARLFDPEIAGLEAGQRMVTCAGLATVCGWSTWEALRVEQGLSVDDARQTLACLLRLLLAGEPLPPAPAAHG